MLRPHDREHAQLGEIGLAPKNLDDLLVLVVREVMLSDEVLGVWLRLQIHFPCIKKSLPEINLHHA